MSSNAQCFDECISCLQNRLLSFSSWTELVAENSSNSSAEFRVQMKSSAIITHTFQIGMR
jgi:hypothetical protein